MKRLNRYYYLVGLPIALLILGTVFFFDAIAGTIRGNPHPQINYIIFVLLAGGSALMMHHVIRINREGKLLQDFLNEVQERQNDTEHMRQWLKTRTSRHASDIADVLELTVDCLGAAVGPVQHAAIESEVKHLDAQLQRRLLLAQALSGLMVGMGLLGTFIGLLGALAEIGNLIGSFAMGPGMSDPVAAISELVTRLTAPMKSMGVAFSASLFGVLGSIVVGLLLVFVRSATGELLSLVQSRVSWLIDIGTAGDAYGLSPINDALADLAEQSPLLKALAIALDQSERRVRTMLTAFEEVTGQLRATAAGQDALLSQLQVQDRKGDEHLAEVRASHETLKLVASAQQRLEEKAAQHEPVAQQVRDLIEFAQARQEALHAANAALQQELSARFSEQQAAWLAGMEAMNVTVQNDRQAMLTQFEAIAQMQRQSQDNLLRIAERIEQVQSGQSSEWRNFAEATFRNQNDLRASQHDVSRVIAELAAELRSDGQQRQQINEKLRLSIEEQASRQEQLVHALLREKV